MTTPRTGGTVEAPAGLYLPGTGTCPDCNRPGVRTYAAGRIGAHEPLDWSGKPGGPGAGTTCTGWGKPATSWIAGDL